MDLSAFDLCVPPQEMNGTVNTVGVAVPEGVHLMGGEAISYCEWHAVLGPDDKIVWYSDTAGSLIAKMSLNLRAGRFTPIFAQIDYRSGELRQTELIGNRWRLTYKKDEESDIKQKEALKSDVDVLGPGFVEAILALWSELDEGDKYSFDFGSTVLQKTIRLRLVDVAPQRCPRITGAVRCFWVEPDNFLLRVFFDKIELAFNSEKELIFYKGLVNLQSEAGEKQALEIHYFH